MTSSTALQHILSAKDAVIVLDGGLATELERKGYEISSRIWSAEALISGRTLIEDVHLDYYTAGADVAITASYQASARGLMEYDPSFTAQNAMRLIQDSVKIAMKARVAAKAAGITRELFIAGSVGPYGAYLGYGSEYTGDYSLPKHRMMTFHRPRVQALVGAGVDALAFETIPSYPEAAVLLQLLEECAGMVGWFSFTLKDDNHISDGSLLSDVVTLLADSDQVLGIGINCVSESVVEGALATLNSLTSKPLVVYPNSGEVYDAGTKTWSGEPSQGAYLKEKVQRWHSLGARLVGGCCRTTPDSIRTISEALRPT